MTPLRIRARLLCGFVARDPWSPAIDGILAAVAMQEQLGPDDYLLGALRRSDLVPVEGLPLGVERDGDLWWYQASCPIVVAPAGREQRHFHRRFDDQCERHLAPNIRRVATSAGPYKNSRLWDTRTLCTGVEWHAIGDREEIERLLRRVTQIGGRRGVGYGEVTDWTIDDGDAELASHYRPLPAAYAHRLGIDGMIVPRGLVPPCRMNPIDCVMPAMRVAHA